MPSGGQWVPSASYFLAPECPDKWDGTPRLPDVSRKLATTRSRPVRNSCFNKKSASGRGDRAKGVVPGETVRHRVAQPERGSPRGGQREMVAVGTAVRALYQPATAPGGRSPVESRAGRCHGLA
ncbi:hypothetical protein GCM10012275_01610 [Longimycelium tulufanense]|uniref:Uncharacterized protein n=1 Tax=Longimycelium tulufanense TaxID=907463 RepID=A0A8J3FTF2_9PSEU|nr:hypothetical protein GCM10012275_01610 [Longimycelium tulufanense]